MFLLRHSIRNHDALTGPALKLIRELLTLNPITGLTIAGNFQSIGSDVVDEAQNCDHRIVIGLAGSLAEIEFPIMLTLDPESFMRIIPNPIERDVIGMNFWKSSDLTMRTSENILLVGIERIREIRDQLPLFTGKSSQGWVIMCEPDLTLSWDLFPFGYAGIVCVKN